MPDHSSGDRLLGQVVDDRYRILKVIGRGGMGVVYEAEATRLGKRLCAVKVLLPEFTRNQMAVARFAREAQVAGRVKHPNVVEIFDTGTTKDGLGYIAMELLRGESLDRTLRRDGALPWPRAQRIIVQICRALAAAHAEGIVHRDMKPENCFRCSHDDEDDFIKVLDFGIAKLTDPEASPDAARLTTNNSVIGTYSYMAFEQIRGEEVDHRVDVWASGVILYELLTGQLPFRGNNQGQIWRAITEYDPMPLRDVAPQAGIPEALELIVRRALARSLTDRYPTIEALGRALAGVQGDGPIRSFTGRLVMIRPDPPAMTLGVAATMAMEGPRLSPRTEAVPSHGLTELGPEDLVDTDETAVPAVLTPSTRPDHQTQLAPLHSDARQTAIAEPFVPGMPAPFEPIPVRRRLRPAALLLAGFGLPAAMLAVILSQGTGAIDSTAPSEPPAPPSEQAPNTIPTLPFGPPPMSAVAPPPSGPVPGVAPPSPVPKPTPKKPTLTFPESVKSELKRFRPRLRKCLSDVEPTMKLTITIAAQTGVATAVTPFIKRSGMVAICIENAFKAKKFSKGSDGDADYVDESFYLSR